MRIGQTMAAGLLALAAQGGVAPYAYSIVSGSLPAGLTLNSLSGNITGHVDAVSDSAGTSNAGFHGVVAQVQDADGAIFQDGFSFNVEHVISWVQDEPPAQSEVGIPFSYLFKATGPGANVSYSISWPFTTPAWVTFTSDGRFSGTPSTTAVPAFYTITATDSVSGDQITYDGSILTNAALNLNVVTGVVMPISSTFDGAIVDVALVHGVAPYTFRIDQTTVPASLTASITANGRFGIAHLVSDGTPITTSITVTVTDALDATASTNVDITTFVPNQQLNAGDGATSVFNPNAITFDPGTFDVTDDGSGGLLVVGLGGDSGGPFTGNQVITADDEFGHSVVDPASLRIYSDDGSVDVEAQPTSDGGLSWRLRAIGGDSGGPFGGGPYLTGLPALDSSGFLVGGDSFDFTPTLNNAGAGNTAQNWELLNDSINAAWASIDAGSGEVTGTLPVHGGYVQLNIACTILDGMFAGASCFSRVPLSITGGNWYDGIVNASSHAIVFDINDLTTLYTDVLHTTLANVGDTVKAIFNKGSAGGYATSSTGQVLAFDSGRSLYYLEGPTNGTSGTQPFIYTWSGSEFMGSGSITILCAAEFFATTDYQYTCQFGLDSDNGGSHGHLILGNNQSDGGYELLNGGGGGSSVPTTGFASGAHVFGGIADSSTASYTHYIDGTAIHGQSGINYHVLSTKQLSVFDYYGSNAAAPCKKNYSYVAVDRVITSSEMTFAGANAL